MQKKPSWLHTSFASDPQFAVLRRLQEKSQIATVCQESRCPNRGECWSSGTATFMLMGDVCTRACRFCAVKTAKNPSLPNPEEAQNVMQAMQQLNLKFIVFTSVTRDDLADQGVGHLVTCIDTVKEAMPDLYIEALVPDFQGEQACFLQLGNSQVDVLSHNIETVERLTPTVRDSRAKYQQSLDMLAFIKEKFPNLYTKTSLMLGLGETEEEVRKTLQDIRNAKVDFITLGQYLQPLKTKLPVVEYITPLRFKQWQEECLVLGFSYAACGALVRSSYKAGEYFFTKQDRR